MRSFTYLTTTVSAGNASSRAQASAMAMTRVATVAGRACQGPIIAVPLLQAQTLEDRLRYHRDDRHDDAPDPAHVDDVATTRLGGLEDGLTDLRRLRRQYGRQLHSGR